MKLIQKIARSRLVLPVCGALSLMAIVYIGFSVREVVTDTPLAQRMMLLMDLPTDTYIEEMTEEQEVILLPEQEMETETFTAREEIALPEAPMPEQSPSQSVPEVQTSPSENVQMPQQPQQPSQSIRPEVQKPTESVTTKPPHTTQKPSQTTKPPQTTQKPQQTAKPDSAPVSAWSVTYKQAKSMVKADSAYDYEDLYWLSRVISAEAKGESFTGQIGVGTVVLNRVRSKEFPNTVKGVVFDRKYGTQFTPVANGTIYDAPTASAVVAAKMCLDGYTLSNSVLYFVNPRIASSSWIQNNRKYAFRIGNHDFYH